MSTKFKKKSGLHFENGYILNKKDKIVHIPCYIVDTFNDMDEWMRRAEFEKKKSKKLKGYTKVKNLKFNPNAERIIPKIKVEDTSGAVARTIKDGKNVAKFIREKESANDVNRWVENNIEFIEWLDSEKIVYNTDIANQKKIYTPYFGDPLKLNSKTFMKTLAKNFGVCKNIVRYGKPVFKNDTDGDDESYLNNCITFSSRI